MERKNEGDKFKTNKKTKKKIFYIILLETSFPNLAPRASPSASGRGRWVTPQTRGQVRGPSNEVVDSLSVVLSINAVFSLKSAAPDSSEHRMKP